MKIKEILIEGIRELKKSNIEDANIKAKLLLQYVINKDKSYIIVNQDKSIAEKDKERYLKHINEIKNGRPLQYITNQQEFMNINFYVDENVLIPQPDTEILVEETMNEIEKIKREGKLKETNTIRILDLCTGSGAVAISIAKEYENRIKKEDKLLLEIYASDISEETLKVAQKNVEYNKVKIELIKSDMFEEFKNKKIEKFDIIVSNPPYIEEDKIELLPSDVKNEPYIALNGGKDGLDFYKVISKEAQEYLKEEGTILLEIGYNQKEMVTDIFNKSNNYSNIICKKDLSGNDRVIIVKCI